MEDEPAGDPFSLGRWNSYKGMTRGAFTGGSTIRGAPLGALGGTLVSNSDEESKENSEESDETLLAEVLVSVPSGDLVPAAAVRVGVEELEPKRFKAANAAASLGVGSGDDVESEVPSTVGDGGLVVGVGKGLAVVGIGMVVVGVGVVSVAGGVGTGTVGVGTVAVGVGFTGSAGCA